MPIVFVIALLAARASGSEDIRDMGGIATKAPVLAALFLILTFALLAMPGSANFIGEFFILLGAFESKTAIAIVASVGVAMAAVYALRLFITAMHNRVGPRVEPREMTLAEGAVLWPLVLVILALALYPQLALERGEGAVKDSLAKIEQAGEPGLAAGSRRAEIARGPSDAGEVFGHTDDGHEAGKTR